MTYSLTRPMPCVYLPAYYTRGMGGFAGLGAPEYKPECVAWADENYRWAAFEAKRRSVERFISENAPVWPGPHTLGAAVSPQAAFAPPNPMRAWADLEPLGYARVDPRRGGPIATVYRRGPNGAETMQVQQAWTNHFYTLYLRKAAYFLYESMVFLEELAKLVNLPVYWLFPTNPAVFNSPEARESVLNPEAYQASKGVFLLSSPSGVVPGLARGVSGRLTLKPQNLQMPLDLVTGKWRIAGLAPGVASRDSRYGFGSHGFRSADNPNKGAAYKGNPNDLADFWKGFTYTDRPSSESNPYGYPAGLAGWFGGLWGLGAGTLSTTGSTAHLGDRSGPPVAYVNYVRGASDGGQTVGNFLGPILAVQTAIQALRSACSRPGVVVVGNAFQSWGSHLEFLATSSPAPNRNGVDPRAVLALSFKTAGQALMIGGTAAANPVVAGAGAVLTLAAEVAKILPGMTPGKISGGAQPLREPLLVRPPEGCEPRVALDRARRYYEKTFWDKALPYLTHPVTLTVVGLAAAYGVYRVVSGRKANGPRGRGRRRNPHWKFIGARTVGGKRFPAYRLTDRERMNTFSLALQSYGMRGEGPYWELACWKGKGRTLIIDRQGSDEPHADALDRLKLKAERMLAAGKCQGWP